MCCRIAGLGGFGEDDGGCVSKVLVVDVRDWYVKDCLVLDWGPMVSGHGKFPIFGSATKR